MYQTIDSTTKNIDDERFHFSRKSPVNWFHNVSLEQVMLYELTALLWPGIPFAGTKTDQIKGLKY